MWRPLLVIIAFVLGCIPAAVEAHPLVQNSMWVVFSPGQVRVALNVSLKEIVISQQLPEPSGVPISREEAAVASEWNGDYVLRHLALAVDGKELPGRVTKITPPATFNGDPEQTLYQYELEYVLPAGAQPARVAFREDMLHEFRYAIGQDWDVAYVVRFKRNDQQEAQTALLRANIPQEFATGWGAETAKPSASSGFEFLPHGIMHILTGYDHLLFVSALVLATLSFWEMFQVIAAFTLAHTITLAVSTLTGFRLPDTFVEPVIAGSIVFVALQNMIAPQRSRGWIRLAIAFGFGLVHGLGFAGGLRDAMGDLGTQSMIIALITFSLGVEIGHQIVVLPLFGLLKLGERQFATTFRGCALRYGSLVISLAGSYYLYVALQG